MTSSLPSYKDGGSRGGGDKVDGRLRDLLDAAHRQWTSPAERPRMRAFGFRPAVEEGVLKREWHGLRVRVSGKGVRAFRPESGELTWVPSRRELLLNGGPFTPEPHGMELVEALLNLIGAYERWVEAREGREGRIQRARIAFPDKRPVNALAETRRLQRLLHQSGGRGR